MEILAEEASVFTFEIGNNTETQTHHINVRKSEIRGHDHRSRGQIAQAISQSEEVPEASAQRTTNISDYRRNARGYQYHTAMKL